MDRALLNRIINEVIAEKIPQRSSGKLCREGECVDNHCVVHNTEGVRAILNQGACRISSGIGVGSSGGIDPELARMIDHTILKPEATPSDIEKLCTEARTFCFASVCVNPSFVPLCARLLRGSGVKVCSVIGFPLGTTSTASKAYETDQVIKEGAEEVDMVIHVGMLKAGEYRYVEHDIFSVTSIAKRHRILSKVILETGLLTDEEKVRACVLAKRAGADFVKTSTGFGKGGATAGDIALMRRVVGTAMGVKASGGVRTREEALAMVASGADRIGASASVKIVTGGPHEAPPSY